MKRIGTGLLALWALWALWVQAEPVDDLVRQLSAIQTMQAHFTQITHDTRGELLQQNQGVLKARTPAMFYWQTAEPYPQTVVTDGVKLWVYDPDLAQVQVRDFTPDYQQTPAMLFTGNAESIASRFAVAAVAGSEGRYRLLPKDHSRDLFTALEVQFHGDEPASLLIEDAMQQKTEILFNEVLINPPLSDTEFQFTAPVGVEVLAE